MVILCQQSPSIYSWGILHYIRNNSLILEEGQSFPEPTKVSSKRCKYKRMAYLKDWLLPALEKRGTDSKWWKWVLSSSSLDSEPRSLMSPLRWGCSHPAAPQANCQARGDCACLIQWQGVRHTCSCGVGRGVWTRKPREIKTHQWRVDATPHHRQRKET